MKNKHHSYRFNLPAFIETITSFGEEGKITVTTIPQHYNYSDSRVTALQIHPSNVIVVVHINKEDLGHTQFDIISPSGKVTSHTKKDVFSELSKYLTPQ